MRKPASADLHYKHKGRCIKYSAPLYTRKLVYRKSVLLVVEDSEDLGEVIVGDEIGT